jgi:cold shock CspA family protein
MKALNRKEPINSSGWVKGLIEWFDPDKGYGFVSFEGSEMHAFLQQDLMNRVTGYQKNTRIERVPVQVVIDHFERTGCYNVKDLLLA